MSTDYVAKDPGTTAPRAPATRAGGAPPPAKPPAPGPKPPPPAAAAAAVNAAIAKQKEAAKQQAAAEGRVPAGEPDAQSAQDFAPPVPKGFGPAGAGNTGNLDDLIAGPAGGAIAVASGGNAPPPPPPEEKVAIIVGGVTMDSNDEAWKAKLQPLAGKIRAMALAELSSQNDAKKYAIYESKTGKHPEKKFYMLQIVVTQVRQEGSLDGKKASVDAFQVAWHLLDGDTNVKPVVDTLWLDKFVTTGGKSTLKDIEAPVLEDIKKFLPTGNDIAAHFEAHEARRKQLEAMTVTPAQPRPPTDPKPPAPKEDPPGDPPGGAGGDKPAQPPAQPPPGAGGGGKPAGPPPFATLYLNFEFNKAEPIGFTRTKADGPSPDCPPMQKVRAVEEQVYGTLLANPACKLEIVGHTCDIGSVKNNQWISDQRAQFVASMFQGLPDKSRIVTRGAGKSQPRVEPKGKNDAEKEPARAQNRRVEVRLIG